MRISDWSSDVCSSDLLSPWAVWQTFRVTPFVPMKIAVIGSGIAGLSAAYLLARRHDVTVFEQDARVGGHTNTVEVQTPDGVLALDTGSLVCTPFNYPHLNPPLVELGFPRQDPNTTPGLQ